MEKTLAAQIMREAQAALEDVATRHGLTLKKSGAVYLTNGGLRLKACEFRSKESNGVEWNANARRFGLPLDAVGKIFIIGGVSYKVVGIRPAAHKRPVLASDPDGKMYTWAAGAAAAALRATEVFSPVKL